MTNLKDRIQQSHFESKGQEALLHLFSSSSLLRENINALCKEHGLSLAQFNILRILRGGRPNGYSRCEIQKRMVERAPDITRLLDRLINAGFVKRQRDENDKRLSVARITDKGLKQLSQLDKPVRDFQQDFEKRLGTDDLEKLIKICQKIQEEE